MSGTGPINAPGVNSQVQKGQAPAQQAIISPYTGPTPKPGTTQPISTNTTPANQPNSPTDLYSSLLSSFDPESNSVMNLFQGVLGDNSTTSTNTANTPNSGLDLTSWLTTLDPSLGSLMKSLGLTTSTNSFDFSSFFGSNFGTSGATNTSSLPLPLNPDPQVDPRINYALDLLGKAPGKYTSGNNTIQIADTNGISTATVSDTTSGKTTATYSWDGKSTLQIQDESGNVDVTFGPDAIGVFNKSTNSGYFLIPNGKGYTQQSSAPSNPTNSNPTNPVNPVNPNPVPVQPTPVTPTPPVVVTPPVVTQPPVINPPPTPTPANNPTFPLSSGTGNDSEAQYVLTTLRTANGYLTLPEGSEQIGTDNVYKSTNPTTGVETVTISPAASTAEANWSEQITYNPNTKNLVFTKIDGASGGSPTTSTLDCTAQNDGSILAKITSSNASEQDYLIKDGTSTLISSTPPPVSSGPTIPSPIAMPPSVSPEASDEINTYNRAIAAFNHPIGESQSPDGKFDFNVTLQSDGSLEAVVSAVRDPNEPPMMAAPGGFVANGIERFTLKPDGTIVEQTTRYGGAYAPTTTRTFTRDDEKHTLTDHMVIGFGNQTQSESTVIVDFLNGSSQTVGEVTSSPDVNPVPPGITPIPPVRRFPMMTISPDGTTMIGTMPGLILGAPTPGFPNQIPESTQGTQSTI